jgi:anti-anti-sigma factor
MDSSGLAMLLRTADQSGPIVIRQPTGTVRRIIQATGLSDVLRVEA